MTDERGVKAGRLIGRWILALLVLAMASTFVPFQPIGGGQSIFLGRSTSVFVDESGQMGIEEVVARQGELFRHRDTASAGRLGTSPHARFWISLTVPYAETLRTSGWTSPFVIAIKDPRIRHAELFLNTPSGITERTWDRHDGLPMDGEGFRYPVFALDPGAFSGATVFMAIEKRANVESALWLSDFQSFFALYDADTTRLSILLGVMGAIFIYILVLGIFLKNSTNLWLAGCTAASLLYFLSENGLVDTLLRPAAAPPSSELVPTAVFLIYASFTAFTARFLAFKRTAPRLTSMSNVIVVAMTAGAALVAIEGMFDVDLLRRLVPYLGLAIIGFIFWGLVAAGRNAPSRSLFFLLAWSPAIVIAMVRLGVVVFPGAAPNPLIANALGLAFVASLLLFTGIASIDIQQRETRMKGEILHNANRFRAFAEIGTDLFWEVDHQGSISFVTGRQVGGTKFTLGAPFLDSLDDVTSSERVRPLREAILAGLPFDDRRLRIEAGDDDLWISLSGRPITALEQGVVYRGAGRSVYRGLIRDVTNEVERENRRQLEQQMFALGQLAGSVAHEINNLIHPIINLTKRLRLHLRDTIDPASSRMMDLIDISSKQAATVVSELLQTTRGERWKDTHRPISTAVEHSVEAIKPALPSSMRIDCLVESCDEVTVKIGDILQIIGNLLSNAVHAVQGAGTVVVTLAHSEGGAKLVVADNGAGMEEAVRRKAMQPFFSTKVDGEGTGVGLYIVQRIVQEYGGTISIGSAPGNGTAVTIFFPRRKDDNG